MSKRTVTNEPYKGLLESVSIPAEVVECAGAGAGRQRAECQGAVPVHCCDQEEVARRAATTHHYCDIFTDAPLAPLDEMAFVRIDDTTAEKVFINRAKRILITSSDGRLAAWRAAPTFESSNQYIAGAPLVGQAGALVSIVTAKRGNHYAVSCAVGDGGYFETTEPWTILDQPGAGLLYADKSFETREALRDHIAALGAPQPGPPRPVLWRGPGGARVALVAPGGHQLAHYYLHNVTAQGVEYL